MTQPHPFLFVTESGREGLLCKEGRAFYNTVHTYVCLLGGGQAVGGDTELATLSSPTSLILIPSFLLCRRRDGQKPRAVAMTRGAINLTF